MRVHIERIITHARVGPVVADRLRRMNPEWVPAEAKIRGLHPKEASKLDLTVSLYFQPLGTAVRAYGRELLDFIPPTAIIKLGRRKYVSNMRLHDALEWVKAPESKKVFGRYSKAKR